MTYSYRHAKDQQKEQLALVLSATHNHVDLLDGGIAQPHGRSSGLRGGISVRNETNKLLVYGKGGFQLFPLTEAEAAVEFASRRSAGKAAHYLYRSLESDWDAGACSWTLPVSADGAPTYDLRGHAVIGPSGPGSTAADSAQQYTIHLHALGGLSVVVADRLGVWQLVGLLVKPLRAAGLDAWLSGGPADTRELALLYFAESLLFAMYDGDECAEAADELAYKLLTALVGAPELTAADCVADLTPEELVVLNECVDAFCYSNDDEREDGEERWRAARAVIDATKKDDAAGMLIS